MEKRIEEYNKIYIKVFNEQSRRYLGGKGFENDIFRCMEKVSGLNTVHQSEADREIERLNKRLKTVKFSFKTIEKDYDELRQKYDALKEDNENLILEKIGDNKIYQDLLVDRDFYKKKHDALKEKELCVLEMIKSDLQNAIEHQEQSTSELYFRDPQKLIDIMAILTDKLESKE